MPRQCAFVRLLKPSCANVGVPGSAGVGCAVETASTRIWPACTKEATALTLVHTASTWPPSVAATAGAPPLYGTHWNLTPVVEPISRAKKLSADSANGPPIVRFDVLPALTRSAHVFSGLWLRTPMMYGSFTSCPKKSNCL